MMKNMKTWVTPELIVLIRSKPEEAVLEGCKTSGSMSIGAPPGHAACDFVVIACNPCIDTSGS